MCWAHSESSLFLSLRLWGHRSGWCSEFMMIKTGYLGFLLDLVMVIAWRNFTLRENHRYEIIPALLNFQHDFVTAIQNTTILCQGASSRFGMIFERPNLLWVYSSNSNFRETARIHSLKREAISNSAQLASSGSHKLWLHSTKDDVNFLCTMDWYLHDRESNFRFAIESESSEPSSSFPLHLRF